MQPNYLLHFNKTKLMLSLFLNNLGFATMAKDIKSLKHEDKELITKYAQIVLNNIKQADLKEKVTNQMKRINLI